MVIEARNGQGETWETRVLYNDLAHCKTGVCVVKIHQAVHLRFMCFMVSILYLNKNFLKITSVFDSMLFAEIIQVS